MINVLKTAAKQGTKAAAMSGKAFDNASDTAMNAVEKVADTVSIDSFLRYAGLQRRSTLMSVMSPAIGALCGFVAGSAVTYFFGPKLLEQLNLKDEGAGAHDDVDSHEQPMSSTGTGSSMQDETSMNSGLHRGMS
jgi:hypothetical protein